MLKRNAKKLELLSMWMMVFGVIALCQPWGLFLHRYSATIIIAGLIMFNIFSRIAPQQPQRGVGQLPVIHS
jgi:hypothetical protein